MVKGGVNRRAQCIGEKRPLPHGIAKETCLSFPETFWNFWRRYLDMCATCMMRVGIVLHFPGGQCSLLYQLSNPRVILW